ncbi:hypothetical protein Q7P37_010494 [Cladosporium fusiforme]
MERPVLRSELRSASPTPSPPSDDEALERLRNLNTLQFATQDVQMNDAPQEPAAVDDDEEMAFQLFAPSKPATKDAQPEAEQSVQKIRIRSPSVDLADAGFLRPNRPQSYYFAEPANGEEKAELAAAALSGEQILKLSTLPRPGCAYNWKVLHIPSSQVSRAARLQTPAGFSKLGQLEAPTKRKRAGKKLRIKMRTKAAASKAKQEAAQKTKEAKEEAEKEKRTRRNREKKVKRKAKEKAKKAEGGGDAAQEGEDVSSGEE